MDFVKSIPYWILGLLVLSVLILVHETGHYTFGRIFKFKINEFSVGMGPKLFSKEKKGIVYSLRAIPLGGFVAFYGEDSEECENPDSLCNKPWWQRAIVMFAGAGFNIIFAILCIGILVCSVGYTAPKIASVSENSGLYEKAEENDILYAINGHQILSTSNLTELLDDVSNDDYVEFTVIRNGEKIKYSAKRFYDVESEKYLFGFNYSYGEIKENIFSSMIYSVKYNAYLTKETYKFLGQLVCGKADISNVTGPVSTIGTMGGYLQEAAEYEGLTLGQRVREVIIMIINFLGVISMNLAVMNLLPIPALDGFRLLFALIEGITKKSIPRKSEAIINTAGLIVVFGLVIALEISKLFQ